MGSMKSRFQLQCAAGGLTTALLTILIAAVFIGPAVAEIDEFDGSSYARNVSLDNVNIFWTIDPEIDTIRLALHAKVDSAELGWAGVGVSEMGGMEGADIVVYETAVRFGQEGSAAAQKKSSLCSGGKTPATFWTDNPDTKFPFFYTYDAPVAFVFGLKAPWYFCLLRTTITGDIRFV